MLRTRKISALVTAGAVGLLGPVITQGPAARADTPAGTVSTPLTQEGFAALAVDDKEQVEFVSEWGNKVDEFSRTGALKATIAGLGQSAGLAFSPSADLLFIAQPKADRIELVNAKTLYFAGAINLPTGSTPDWIALAGGKLWIGAGGTTKSLLFEANPTAGATATAVKGPSLGDAPYLSSGGETSVSLTATDFSDSAPPLYFYKVVNGALQYRTNLNPGGQLDGISFSPDGQDVSVAVNGYANVNRYRLDDFSLDGEYIPPGGDALGAALTADGKYFVTGQDPESYPTDRSYPAQDSGLAAASVFGLAVSGDGAEEYVIARHGRLITLDTAAGPEATETPVPAAGPIGLRAVTGLVADTVHGHLFASGSQDGVVDVLDLTGRLITQIPGMWGATHMALSPDGQELFVALSLGDSVAVINTSTLTAVKSLRTGAGSAPNAVVITSGRVWANAYAGNSTGLSSKSLTALDSPWVASGAGVAQELATSPSVPGVIVGSLGQQLPQGYTAGVRYAISGTTATESTIAGSGQTAEGPAISPDGKTVGFTCATAAGTTPACAYDETLPVGGGTATSYLTYTRPYTLAFGNDSRLLYLANDTETDQGHQVEIVDRASGNVLWHSPDPEYSDDIEGMVLSPDDRTAYLITNTNTGVAPQVVRMALPDEGEPTAG